MTCETRLFKSNGKNYLFTKKYYNDGTYSMNLRKISDDGKSSAPIRKKYTVYGNKENSSGKDMFIVRESEGTYSKIPANRFNNERSFMVQIRYLDPNENRYDWYWPYQQDSKNIILNIAGDISEGNILELQKFTLSNRLFENGSSASDVSPQFAIAKKYLRKVGEFLAKVK